MPAKGKPQPNEHTVLAGIVLCLAPVGAASKPWEVAGSDPTSCQLRCVALGTGTKCVGRSRRCAEGYVVNDGHAEVLARRALQRWLLLETLAARLGLSDSLEPAGDRGAAFRLRPNASLHMYVSQPPCGDASIWADDASGRTGAKPLDSDPLGGGALFVPTASDVESGCQAEGILRRKPGKGDPTLSMSCSDKIARWCCLGLQGSLLLGLLGAPLFLSSISTGIPPPNPPEGALARAAEALWRAVAGRTRQHAEQLCPEPFGWRPPAVCCLPTEPAGEGSLGLYPVDDVRAVGAGHSIAWSECCESLRRLQVKPPAEPSPEEAAVLAALAAVFPPLERSGHSTALLGTTGKRMGAKKTDSPPKAAAELCKRRNAERLLAVARAIGSTAFGASDSGQCYREAKRAIAPGYFVAWDSLLGTTAFRGWIHKPANLEGFPFSPEL